MPKRLLILVLAAVCLVSIAGCGAQQDAENVSASLYSQDPDIRRSAFVEIATAMPLPVEEYNEEFWDEPLPEAATGAVPDGDFGELRAFYRPSATDREAFTDLADMSEPDFGAFGCPFGVFDQ